MKFKLLIFFLITLLALTAAPLHAAETLSLSIAPPLFELKVQPSEIWSSIVKIINTNPYDLTVYASVLNFEANGEEGQGKFMPMIGKEIDQHLLSQWIKITDQPITILAEKSIELPFSINVPADAPPGGHYAAILVGTRPLKNTATGPSISVASMVSSLLFVQIGGEEIISGSIREFSTEKTFYQKPDINFMLRFSNTGNVHVQPQGDITIYDMWGEARGRIPINPERIFGNVLPNTTRKFNFEWSDKKSFMFGRYTAIATLGFGNTTRQNTSRAIHFWVLPLKPILGILSALAILITIIVVSIRFYVRKTLATANMELQNLNPPSPVDVKPKRTVKKRKLKIQISKSK